MAVIGMRHLAETTKAMQLVLKNRYEAFATAGWAGKIRPLSLDDMSLRHARGELDALVL